MTNRASHIFRSVRFLFLFIVSSLVLSGCPQLMCSMGIGDCSLLLESSLIQPENVTVKVGEKQTLAAKGIQSDGTVVNLGGQVSWYSADPLVVTVDAASGVIEGVTAGIATVTASVQTQDGFKEGEASVLVTGTDTTATLSSIAVTPSNPSVSVNATQQFTATGTYSDSSTADLTNIVTWSSSDVSLATINNSGLVTGIAAGSVTITAASGSLSGTAALTVDASPPTAATLTAIAVTPLNPSVDVNGTQQFTATGTYSDSSTVDLTSTATWGSSNTSKATINTNGLATGVAAGSTYIAAGVGSVYGTTTLTILVALSSIAVTPSNPSIDVGVTQQFTATGTYSDNSTVDLTSTVIWSSNNTNLVTINSSGLTTGMAVGSATITATLGSVSSTATLTITPLNILENFNSGTLNSTLFSSSNNANGMQFATHFHTNYMTGFAGNLGSSSAYFGKGGTSSGTPIGGSGEVREIQTDTFYGYSIVTFDIVIANYTANGQNYDPDEETADSNEVIELYYSTDGGSSWNLISNYGNTSQTATNTHDYWKTYTESIPSGTTNLKWSQYKNSGDCCDHWALDNIIIQ